MQEAQSKISSKEFYDWCLFFRTSPPIGDRVDFALGQLCLYVVGLFHDSKKNGKLELSMFLPPWVEKEETKFEETRQEFLSRAKSAFGGLAKMMKKKS